MLSPLACQYVCRLTAAQFSSAHGQMHLPQLRPQATSLKQQVCCNLPCPGTQLHSHFGTLATPVSHCICDTHGSASVVSITFMACISTYTQVELTLGVAECPSAADCVWNGMEHYLLQMDLMH